MLVLTGSLNVASDKTPCQTAMLVFSWMNVTLLFVGLFMSILYTECKTNCDPPDYVDRFDLLSDLRNFLSLNLNKVSSDHLLKSVNTTQALLQKNTKPDSRLFLFTLLALTPFTSFICILGFNCYPSALGNERALLTANTLSAGLATFGLYKNYQRSKQGEQQLIMLTYNNV